MYYIYRVISNYIIYIQIINYYAMLCYAILSRNIYMYINTHSHVLPLYRHIFPQTKPSSSRHRRSAAPRPIPSPRVTWVRPPSVFLAAAEAPVAASSVTWAGNRLRPGDREVQNGEKNWVILAVFPAEVFPASKWGGIPWDDLLTSNCYFGP